VAPNLARMMQPRVAQHPVADPIARVVVQPRVLAGKNGELADRDLLGARRSDVEILIRALLAEQLGTHAEIEVDWRESARPAGVAAITAAGAILPIRDRRHVALCAAASEAVMMACD